MPSIGILVGRNANGIQCTWRPLDAARKCPHPAGLPFCPAVTATSGIWIVHRDMCRPGRLRCFSSVAWESITFTAGEVKDPKRNIPRSLFWGAALVIALYLLGT